MSHPHTHLIKGYNLGKNANYIGVNSEWYRRGGVYDEGMRGYSKEVFLWKKKESEFTQRP